ncbi:MAG: transposase, partial [Candidatus Dormibacteraceae bacterium]
LYKWRDQLLSKDTDTAFPGHGRRRGSDAELARLKREVERLHEENEILKKAARYFARESS